MKVSLEKMALLGAFSLLLTACAVEQRMAPRTLTNDWQVITPTKLVVNGVEANVVLSNAADLRTALGAMAGNAEPPSLRALSNQIEAARDTAGASVPGLTGMAGPLGEALLNAGIDALDGGGNFDATHQVIVSVSGQIEVYEFDRVAGTDHGNGRFVVNTTVVTTKIPHGSGPITSKSESYKWVVRVDNNGLKISEWNGTTFPGPTLQFPPATLAWIEAQGFDHKLWAEGMDIVIEDVYQKAGNSSNYVRISETTPKGMKFYAQTDENCIDMLFHGEPPNRLPADAAPPLYCLGRCENPLIVNTGV